MKSVAIFISNDFVHDQRMRRIANAFADLSWRVHVYAVLKKNSLPLEEGMVPCTRLRILPEKGKRFYARMNWRFFIKALAAKSDFLMAVDVDTLPGLRLVSFLKSKPLIWDCHEIFTEMPELYQRPGIKKVWSIVEKFFGRNLSHVITTTRGVADHLMSALGIQAKVIHNYPISYPLESKLDERFKSKILLFQGILNDGRCLPELIYAIKLLPVEYSLVIAGDGHMRATLEKIIHSENLGDRIKITGMLTREELMRLTVTACIGISLLNKEHQNSFVSLANKNLDYIMAGLPCVTVNLPEYAGINKKWKVATLLEEVNIHTIANAVIQLSGDFQKYRIMHLACLEARNYLNWESEVKKLYEFIRSL